VTSKHRRGFWKSLPGVITAAAGLMSATAGLIGGLVATGFIGGSHQVGASTISHSTSSHSTPGTGTPSSGTSIGGTSGNGTSAGGTTSGGTPSYWPPPSSSPAGSSPPSSAPPSSSPPPPAVLVDQVDDPAWTGGVVNIAPANRDSQVFVPSLPHLVAIEVAIMTINAGQGGDTVTLTILDGNGQQVATTSASVAEGFDGFLRFDLPDGGPAVTPGQPLTMMLQDGGKTVFGWKYVGGSPYSRGQAYFNGSTFGTNDFLFRTYGARN
jgi:hypothetical protein